MVFLTIDPVTGGYPVIAVLRDADVDLAGSCARATRAFRLPAAYAPAHPPLGTDRAHLAQPGTATPSSGTPDSA